MEHIILRDSTSIEVEVNGKSLDGKSVSVLLAPSSSMSLAERLTESVMIDVEHGVQGIWREVANA